ncbi:MAG: archaemetzincin family Zn-dependent metalloprotease [Deltaproteobacteria bacterium]|jgi:archaemetzincin|nr:archaemetzincin family Zn-dependent metalloprotease [Deltaproteobacteria bacterium]
MFLKRRLSASKNKVIIKILQKIIISPINNIDVCNYQLLDQEIHRTFGFQTEIKSLLQNVNFAYDLTRDQYHSTAILEKLASISPSQAIKVVAITNVDLFIPILTHVYGEAQLAGKACIVSTFRLQEGLSITTIEKEFENRVVKEVLHELGHTFDLRHCRDKSCIMHYCRSIRDVDRKSDQLCRYCKILLGDELKKL